MKKFMAAALILAAVVGICLAAGQWEAGVRTEYLRVHIRANSNSEEDQSVKYIVRDAVVAYLTPLAASCESKEEAYRAVKDALPALTDVAERTLHEHGFSYGARASLRAENFPTRVYENVTLEAGVYDALILELGTGTGDNWWCVVYPPLCFTSGGGNVVYRSKILEIVRDFFG